MSSHRPDNAAPRAQQPQQPQQPHQSEEHPFVPPPGWREAFEAELLPLLERTEAPGVGITLFTPGEVLLEAGYGHRDVAQGLPVTADTLFGVASITKSVTALSLKLLADDGLLSLDDPVTDYLPFTLWEGREPARLRHFLDHTSGLAPTPTMTWLRLASQADDPVAAEASRAEALSTVAAAADSAAGGGAGDQAGGEAAGEAELARLAAEVSTFEGLVAWLNANAVLLGEPGEVFSYSNDAFCLMGGVVERVTGAPFEEFVRARILAPLGMERSTFDLSRVLVDEDRTVIYERGASGAVLPSPAWQTTGRMLGGGMLKSTLADLRAWVRWLMAQDLPAGAAQAGPGSVYGLGLRTENAGDFSVVGHGGSLKGVSSQIAWVPELGVGVVVLSNLAGLPSMKMALMALNAYAGRPVTEPLYDPAPFAGTAAEEARILSELVGNYASGEPYGRLRLYADATGALRAAVGAPAVDLPAFLVSANEVALRYPEYLSPVMFLRRANGAVWAAHQGSRALLRVTQG